MSGNDTPSPYKKNAEVISEKSPNSTYGMIDKVLDNLSEVERAKLKDSYPREITTTSTKITSEDGSRSISIRRVEHGEDASYLIYFESRNEKGDLQTKILEYNSEDTFQLLDKSFSPEELKALHAEHGDPRDDIYVTTITGDDEKDGVKQDPEHPNVRIMEGQNSPTISSGKSAAAFRTSIDALLTGSFTGKEAEKLENTKNDIEKYAADGYSPEEIQKIITSFNAVEKEGRKGR